MSNLFSNSAITTKIHGMSSKLLSLEDFRELASCEDIPAILHKLESYQASYKLSFKDKDLDSLHRSEIERILLVDKFHDFTKIYTFANGSQRKFLRLFFIQYEVFLLKRCLRSCLSKRSMKLDLGSFKEFLKKHSNLDFDKLSKAENIRSFIEELEGSIYYENLSKLGDNATLFDYEMSMDLLFFKTIWNKTKKTLSKSEQEIVRNRLGTTIDMLNIQWIYRSKRYYKIPAVDMYSYLIPVYYKLNESILKAMINTDDFQSLNEIFSSTYYGKLSKNLFGSETVSFERLELGMLYRTSRLLAMRYPYSIASISDYLFRKDIEIDMLINVIEAVRYSLPKEQIISKILLLEGGLYK